MKILFLTETRTTGSEEARETFTVSELMHAGAILAALENAAKSLGGSNPVELVPGDFVEFSSDRKALLAMIPGYPQLLRVTDAKGERITVDLEPLFVISEDGWTVKMNLYPPISGKALPEATQLVTMLGEAEVRSGIRNKNIEECLSRVRTEERPIKDQIVARGRLPVNGEDARLRMNIAHASQVGKELGDGQMDFHERHVFTAVTKGQLLATKIPATKGLPGVNIYGHEVPQKPGKDLVIKAAEDIDYDEASGEIRAAIAGVLSAVTESSVRVTSKLNISGDIDFQTGNIESGNAVEISGSIKPGFKVTAGGDLVVGGSVEGALVHCHGNVLIRGGIIGTETGVEADGDVDCAVLAHGSISSKGSVRVSREAYYAEIACFQDIVFSGKARLISSDLLAGGSITVNDVDTETSANSLLAAAIMPDRYTHYNTLLKSFFQAQAAIDAYRRRFGSEVTGDDLDELQEEFDDAKLCLACYNLVIGADERDPSGGIRYSCRQKITVKGLICSGAVIRIGNTEKRLKKNYSEGHFALNGETGALEFHPGGKGLKVPAVEQL